MVVVVLCLQSMKHRTMETAAVAAAVAAAACKIFQQMIKLILPWVLVQFQKELLQVMGVMIIIKNERSKEQVRFFIFGFFLIIF